MEKSQGQTIKYPPLQPKFLPSMKNLGFTRKGGILQREGSWSCPHDAEPDASLASTSVSASLSIGSQTQHTIYSSFACSLQLLCSLRLSSPRHPAGRSATEIGRGEEIAGGSRYKSYLTQQRLYLTRGVALPRLFICSCLAQDIMQDVGAVRQLVVGGDV